MIEIDTETARRNRAEIARFFATPPILVGQLYQWCPVGTLAHPQIPCFMRVVQVLRD